MKLLDYYDIANFPTLRIAIPAHTPEPDPLLALARRDSFAQRVFVARLHDRRRHARLFGEDETEVVAAIERTEAAR